MKIKKYKIPVTKYNNLDFSLRVIDIGDFSQGFASLVSQLHGDEMASTVITTALLEIALKQSKKFKLGLRIILDSNPVACYLGIKNEPISNQNLNRVFSSDLLTKDARNEAEKIAQTIIQLIQTSKFCIDIHDMPGSKLLLSVILTRTENPIIENKNLQLIQAFNPEIVWEEDIGNKNDRQKNTGTINQFLNKINVPNFSIETNPIENLTDKEAAVIAKKILKLFIYNSNLVKRKIRLIKRVAMYSPDNGVINPKKIKLSSKVKKGQSLGALLTTGSVIKIKSPVEGLLIRQVNQGYIEKGGKVFDIGVYNEY